MLSPSLGLALLVSAALVECRSMLDVQHVHRVAFKRQNEDPTGLTLVAGAIQNGSFTDGSADGVPAAGQVASLTSQSNFINFCTSKTLTNGLQVTGGSCNGIPMGDIPSKQNMISAIIVSPAPGSSNIEANTTFVVSVQVDNLVAGFFSNAKSTYYSAPQQLQGGKVVGHTHVTIQSMGDTLNPTAPLNPAAFVFFKGINDPGNGNGLLSATVTGGLPAGKYRVCTLTSATNHQIAVMPVAQRGAQDDCTKFTVSAAGNNGGDDGSDDGGESASSTTEVVESSTTSVDAESSTSVIVSSTIVGNSTAIATEVSSSTAVEETTTIETSSTVLSSTGRFLNTTFAASTTRRGGNGGRPTKLSTTKAAATTSSTTRRGGVRPNSVKPTKATTKATTKAAATTKATTKAAATTKATIKAVTTTKAANNNGGGKNGGKGGGKTHVIKIIHRVTVIRTFCSFHKSTLGGLPPAVGKNGRKFNVIGELFDDLASACQAACGHQFTTCISFSGPGFEVTKCKQQRKECGSAASSATSTQAQTPVVITATVTVPPSATVPGEVIGEETVTSTVTEVVETTAVGGEQPVETGSPDEGDGGAEVTVPAGTGSPAAPTVVPDGPFSNSTVARRGRSRARRTFLS